MTDTTPPLINFDTLSATTDIYGNPLAVGTRVRSFDYTFTRNDIAHGLDLDGPRAAYKEGVIEDIGTQWFEGCPRYRIRYDHSVVGGLTEVDPAPANARLIYPPLNGTPSMFGHPTFGVIALPAGRTTT